MQLSKSPRYNLKLFCIWRTRKNIMLHRKRKSIDIRPEMTQILNNKVIKEAI